MYISTYTELQVDSVPLPRKITSLLPRISFMHLQVDKYFNTDIIVCEQKKKVTCSESIKKFFFIILSSE